MIYLSYQIGQIYISDCITENFEQYFTDEFVQSIPLPLEEIVAQLIEYPIDDIVDESFSERTSYFNLKYIYMI